MPASRADIQLQSRILANRPMIRINRNVLYLSSGTSMAHAAGPVVGLFKDTWMRACGVGRLSTGNRKINKMGNIELLLDVDEERHRFDNAVISVIKTVLPLFNESELKLFYKNLMIQSGMIKEGDEIKEEQQSLVRRGISSGLGKIAQDDLLLSAALSHNSPFFNSTVIGKKIREIAIQKFGHLLVEPEISDVSNEQITVSYPKESDPDFDLLTDDHLYNYDLNGHLESVNAIASQQPQQERTEEIEAAHPFIVFALQHQSLLSAGAGLLVAAAVMATLMTLGVAPAIAVAGTAAASLIASSATFFGIKVMDDRVMNNDGPSFNAGIE